MRKKIFVYLARWHKNTDDIEKKFNDISTKLCQYMPIILKAIDPFKRNIDENDNVQIVSRDLWLLKNKKIPYVIAISNKKGGVLSTGTSFEVILSKYFNKKVIIVSKPPKTGNRYHPFSSVFADVIVNSLKQAIEWIIRDMTNSGAKRPQKLKKIIKKLIGGYKLSKDDINPFY